MHSRLPLRLPGAPIYSHESIGTRAYGQPSLDQVSGPLLRHGEIPPHEKVLLSGTSCIAPAGGCSPTKTSLACAFGSECAGRAEEFMQIRPHRHGALGECIGAGAFYGIGKVLPPATLDEKSQLGLAIGIVMPTLSLWKFRRRESFRPPSPPNAPISHRSPGKNGKLASACKLYAVQSIPWQ